jgi:hypothetical protein
MVRTLFTALVLLMAANAAAQEGTSAGRVVVLRGQAWLQHPHAGATTDTLIKRGDALHEGDTVRTGPGATLRVLMTDNSILDLGESSRVSLPTYKVAARERKASVKLWVGKLWARVASSLAGDKSFEVTTANAVAGVRGTSFGVETDGGSNTNIVVEDGSVEMSNGAGSQLLGPNDQGTASGDGQIGTSKVSDNEVDSSKNSVAPTASLGDDTQGALDDTADVGGASGTSEESADPTEGNEPPIDLDPGSSFAVPDTARVGGRVVLEE